MPNGRKTRRTPAPDARTLRMFSYLDGRLSAVERDSYEAELAADPALAGDVESHRALLATLDEMAAYAPSNDFRMRVLAVLNTPESRWARLRRRLGAPPPPMSNAFAAFLDEGLTARQAGALAALAARDPEAAAALAGWERLFGELGTLPGFGPSEGFSSRVMARLGVEGRRRAARPEPARTGGRRLAGVVGVPAAARRWEIATAWIGSRWPTPRERFAVTSGMAVGPVAVFLVTVHMLSSNPLLTVGNVASFLRIRVGGVVSQVVDAISGNPAASEAMGRVSGLVEAWSFGGRSLAVGLALFGGFTLLSAWILYSNVVKPSRSENRYVSV